MSNDKLFNISNNYISLCGINWWCKLIEKEGSSWLQIPCQKHNLKTIHAVYIYRIISSKKQKGKPYEMDLPSWKTISQPLKQLQNSRYIADRTGFDLGISKRNPNYIWVVWIEDLKGITNILSTLFIKYMGYKVQE